ncbi:hypothetical protein CUN63_12095 [Pseudomonas sp. ACM7]|nr:hypothetical protein CUN63_12095 [Pseudomonas sp. ACM7]
MWERACSRKRCVIQQIGRLTLRIREQARSHTGPRISHKQTPEKSGVCRFWLPRYHSPHSSGDLTDA